MNSAFGGLILGAAATASLAASAALLPAPSAAAQGASAAVTIGQLEASGFEVRLTRVGSAPLEECTVTDIGNPTEQRQFTPRHGRDHDNVFDRVDVRRTISVSLNCAA
jgi:hypothetical protein